MTNLTILSQLLRTHYTDPSPEVQAYIDAYERRTQDTSPSTLRDVLKAWNALSEDQRVEIGLVLDRR